MLLMLHVSTACCTNQLCSCSLPGVGTCNTAPPRGQVWVFPEIFENLEVLKQYSI